MTERPRPAARGFILTSFACPKLRGWPAKVRFAACPARYFVRNDELNFSPVLRLVKGGVIALAISTLGVSFAHPIASAAAPVPCAATQAPATPAASSAALPAAAIPTEAAIAPEVNPPGDIP